MTGVYHIISCHVISYTLSLSLSIIIIIHHPSSIIHHPSSLPPSLAPLTIPPSNYSIISSSSTRYPYIFLHLPPSSPSFPSPVSLNQNAHRPSEIKGGVGVGVGVGCLIIFSIFIIHCICPWLFLLLSLLRLSGLNYRYHQASLSDPRSFQLSPSWSILSFIILTLFK